MSHTWLHMVKCDPFHVVQVACAVLQPKLRLASPMLCCISCHVMPSLPKNLMPNSLLVLNKPVGPQSLSYDLSFAARRWFAALLSSACVALILLIQSCTSNHTVNVCCHCQDVMQCCQTAETCSWCLQDSSDAVEPSGQEAHPPGLLALLPGCSPHGRQVSPSLPLSSHLWPLNLPSAFALSLCPPISGHTSCPLPLPSPSALSFCPHMSGRATCPLPSPSALPCPAMQAALCICPVPSALPPALPCELTQAALCVCTLPLPLLCCSPMSRRASCPLPSHPLFGTGFCPSHDHSCKLPSALGIGPCNCIFSHFGPRFVSVVQGTLCTVPPRFL